MLTIISYKLAGNVGQELGTATPLPGGPGYIPKEVKAPEAFIDAPNVVQTVKKIDPRGWQLQSQIKNLESQVDALHPKDRRRQGLITQLRNLRRQYQQHIKNRPR